MKNSEFGIRNYLREETMGGVEAFYPRLGALVRREQPRGARWQKAALKSEAPFWTSGSGTETA